MMNIIILLVPQVFFPSSFHFLRAQINIIHKAEKNYYNNMTMQKSYFFLDTIHFSYKITWLIV